MLFYQLMLAAPAHKRVDPETARKPKPQFPIVMQSNQSHEAELRVHMGRVSDAAATLIEGLQPYNSPNNGRSSFLAMLHELDIIDKHRLLAALMIAIPIAGQCIELKPGAVFILNFQRPVPFEMHMDLNIPIEVALDEPRAFKDEPLIPALSKMRQFTVDVLNMFVSEFK
jgi:hypothetical protein